MIFLYPVSAFKRVNSLAGIARLRWFGGYWLCAHESSDEALRKAIYGEGLELEGATVARTIFEQLVKEGRRERVR